MEGKAADDSGPQDKLAETMAESLGSSISKLRTLLVRLVQMPSCGTVVMCQPDLLEERSSLLITAAGSCTRHGPYWGPTA